MPTGYTAKLHDGKPQTFEEFALEAARAMGAAIMQRDDDEGPIADEYEPSPYPAESLAKSEALFAQYQKFTADDWNAEELKTRQEMTDHINDSIKVAAERRIRYEQMLAQVEAWRPPSPEHLKFKEFMTEQLTSSIQFDCSTTYLTIPPARSWSEYRDARLAETAKRVERDRQYLLEELERTEGRNKWVRDLRESLISASVQVSTKESAK